MKDAIIVGGGMAGLATAYFLQRGARDLPLEYTLVERQPRFGGKVVSEHLDGFLVEGGPDSMFVGKPWGIDLCRELGLEDQLINANPGLRKVYVLWGGRLREMPEGILALVPTRFWPFVSSPLVSPLGKLRMGLEAFIPPRREDGDESLAHFVRRRLGEEALVKIAEPLLAGIYVADPERMSLKSTFPRFLELERRYGSLLRGALAARHSRRSNANGGNASPFVTLRDGMEEMVEALVGRLDPSALLSGRRVVSLTRRSAGFEVGLDDGRRLRGRSVVLATPAFVAAELIEPLDRSIAGSLREIRYISTATVSLGYRRSEFSHSLNGSGFVVARPEGRALTACTWSSSKFPGRAPEDRVLVRAFFGGPGLEEPVHLGDEDLLDLAASEIRQILGVTGEPVLARVHRWVRGNPQYDVGHLQRIEALEEDSKRLPGLFLAGSPYRGVGIPDCVRDGRRAAREVLAYLRPEAHSEAQVVA